MKQQKGISIISLVITIIILIILSVIVIISSMRTVDEADYSKYVSNVSDVSVAFHEKVTAVNGDKIAESNQKKEEQLYNYVAKAGKKNEDFLVPSDVPVYTIIKDEKQIGIKLPKMKLESGTGKKVNVQYATTKKGQVFTWPPYEHEEFLYVTSKDVVKTKVDKYITVGDETFEIFLDPEYGTLIDTTQSGYLDEPSEEFIVGEHDFRSKVTTPEYLFSEATCTEAAIYYYKCLTCNEKGSMTYTSGRPLGHSYGAYQITKVATCGEIGEQQRNCTRCGDIQTQSIARDTKNHVGDETSAILKMPTCTQAGTRVYKCATCR